MNKRKSIINLSIIVGILIILLVVAFFPGWGAKPYMGFPGTMKNRMDAEGNGGVVVVYKVKQTVDGSKARFSDQLSARLYYIQNELLSNEKTNTLFTQNYRNEIASQGTNRIRIESQQASSYSEIVAAVGKSPSVVFTNSAGELAKGSIISNVRFTVKAQSYVVEIEVTDEGKKILETSSSDAISIIDKAAKDSGKEEKDYKLFDVPAEIFTEGKMSSNKFTLTDTDTNALNGKYARLLAGATPLELTLISAGYISETSASTQATLALVAGIAAAVLLIAFFIVRYRGLGLAAVISMLAYMVLMLFFAAVLPFVSLSFLGLWAIVLMMFVNAGSHIFTFEKIRSEYQKGKSVQASTASGFKKTLFPLLDIHLFALVAGLAVWILGDGAAASAGMIMLFTSILSFASAAGLTMYLSRLFNSILGENLDPGLLGLKRGVHDEIKDEVGGQK